ncbi:MAG TPA: cytochrome c oxidase subunit 3 [Bryobacteraceae bacterium]|nr:cytochrome c oxidase subunit 3 [Bryobacteraceae bacterium]
MTPARVLDVSSLPAYEVSNQSPLWAGQVVMCAIEATLFVILIATYFYLRLGVDVWPPPGTQIPGTIIPTIALIPLLASCAGSYIASEGARKNSRREMLFGMILNLGLAIAFLVLRAISWTSFNFRWNTDAHGSIVWDMLFLHTYDVGADLLMTLVLVAIVAAGRGGPKQRIGVHVDSVLWYFLVGIWIPMYVVIYWGPHLVGAGR